MSAGEGDAQEGRIFCPFVVPGKTFVSLGADLCGFGVCQVRAGGERKTESLSMEWNRGMFWFGRDLKDQILPNLENLEKGIFRRAKMMR